MSIMNTDVIDGIALNGGELVLLLTDELAWDNESEHLLALQEKINAYINFLANREFENDYPDVESACIEIHFKYEPTKNALQFLQAVQDQIGELGILIRCEIG